jgi:DNA-binding NtrC family response regulator
MAHVLVVDDELPLCKLLATLLGERGHVCQYVHSGEAALITAEDRSPDLILLDLHLDGIDGIETLRRLRARAPATPIVIVTAFGNVHGAVAAMKLGATDFVSKPFNNQALLGTIEALLGMRREVRGETSALVGRSPAFKKAMALALKFAVPDINVLLLGQTGTGKELFARTIHDASKRRGGPFVAVDCSMLAENLIESELFGHEKGAFTGATSARVGRLELAQRGTLFLDEIGNLPAQLQAKLLRVLQERRMERVGGRDTIHLDVRVVSATNVDLCEAIHAGTFRQDLYYRLQEMTVRLPPLCERDGDIRSIAEHFLRLYAARFGSNASGLSEAAVERLEAYSWPGNVRELENAMKSAAVLATDVVLPEHLPPEISGDGPPMVEANGTASGGGEEQRLRLAVEAGVEAREIDLKAFGTRAAEQAERALLEALLRRDRMSGAQMARLCGIDPKTLRIKLRRYGLEARLANEG